MAIRRPAIRSLDEKIGVEAVALSDGLGVSARATWVKAAPLLGLIGALKVSDGALAIWGGA